jgi:hypothetical protein
LGRLVKKFAAYFPSRSQMGAKFITRETPTLLSLHHEAVASGKLSLKSGPMPKSIAFSMIDFTGCAINFVLLLLMEMK